MQRTDLINFLPKNYKTLCWEHKAMTRHRGIQNEEELLMLSMFYSYGHSLMEVKNYAKTEFNTTISDVGFMKRLCKAKRCCTKIVSFALRCQFVYPKQ